MGLPQILIEFKGKASSAIARSAKGTVVLVFKDDTKTDKEYVYTDFSKVKAEDWTADNYDLISKTFLGSPTKVIVVRLAEDAADYSEALTLLEGRTFDYMAVPGADSSAKTAITSWIKAQRNAKKYFKAVFADQTGNDEGVINFTTDGIKVGDKTYSSGDYTVRIAGILAGLPLSMSSTFYVLTEVDDITSKVDPDASVDAGELILINDGEKVKIARGVNSLTTIAEPKNKAWKKIKIVEGMDMVRNDIGKTYANDYVGKVPNTYENKMLFFSAANSYLKGLEDVNVLDPSFDNQINIDVAAHIELMKIEGLDPSGMKDTAIREYNTGSTVYADGGVKFLDAMEDLSLGMAM